MIAAGSQLRRQLGLCLASVTLHLPGEQISDASFGLDNLGCARVALLLAAKAENLDVDAAIEHVFVDPGPPVVATTSTSGSSPSAGGRATIGRNCDWPPSLASPARPCANHRGHAPGRTAAPDLERSEGRRRNAPRAGSGADIRSVARTTAYRRRRARRRNGKAAPFADRHQSCSAPCSNEGAPPDHSVDRPDVV